MPSALTSASPLQVASTSNRSGCHPYFATARFPGQPPETPISARGSQPTVKQPKSTMSPMRAVGCVSVNMPRWGNPEGADFHFANCGGFVDESATFGSYTIPVRMRVGWHFGTERFETEGEFFSVSIDDAVYR